MGIVKNRYMGYLLCTLLGTGTGEWAKPSTGTPTRLKERPRVCEGWHGLGRRLAAYGGKPRTPRGLPIPTALSKMSPGAALEWQSPGEMSAPRWVRGRKYRAVGEPGWSKKCVGGHAYNRPREEAATVTLYASPVRRGWLALGYPENTRVRTGPEASARSSLCA
jgi:hypothetical protein